MKKILVVLAIVAFSISAKAQYGYRDGNRIGITLGITQMSLTTNNFKTTPATGWIGGMAVRGNYYNDFSMIFGMQFTESNFSVETYMPLSTKKQDVKYTLSGAQIRLLLSYNLVKDHVSLDFGPVLQVNGKLRIDQKNVDNIVTGTTLKANDITDINKINGNLYMGLSAGNRRVRAILCYEYGFNNILNNLNNKDEIKAANYNKTFNGHMGLISGQILFNL